MISASGEVTSTDILGRLRGGKGRETTVDFAISVVSDSVIKSNT